MKYKLKTYKTEHFILDTNDLNPDVYTDFGKTEMIDFYLHFNDKIFNGCAFTLEGIKHYFDETKIFLSNGITKKHSHFWVKDMIIIKEFSIESLINAINDIINDDTCDLEEVFSLYTEKKNFIDTE